MMEDGAVTDAVGDAAAGEDTDVNTDVHSNAHARDADADLLMIRMMVPLVLTILMLLAPSCHRCSTSSDCTIVVRPWLTNVLVKTASWSGAHYMHSAQGPGSRSSVG